MAQYKITVGSLRRESFNRKRASAVTKLAPAEFSFDPLVLRDELPANASPFVVVFEHFVNEPE